MTPKSDTISFVYTENTLDHTQISLCMIEEILYVVLIYSVLYKKPICLAYPNH